MSLLKNKRVKAILESNLTPEQKVCHLHGLSKRIFYRKRLAEIFDTDADTIGKIIFIYFDEDEHIK